MQTLLEGSDLIAALELITSTQDVLDGELAGVKCLRCANDITARHSRP